MSQHGCPERLSNRSKGFQEDGAGQPTMELLVETLTGTAFEMTVSPSDTIFAIKSKICRVEGIPVSQQHLVYNLRELEDARSLRALGIGDGARLRLVLGMRGGPISTRRLPPPAEPWRDIERLLDSNREESDWGAGAGAAPGLGAAAGGCKVTVVVFRDGERVNMLRVKENTDGTYEPIDHAKYSSSLSQLDESEPPPAEGPPGAGATAGGAGRGGGGGGGGGGQNALTLGKMLELRKRMETLAVRRRLPAHQAEPADIQKTRSEETLPTCPAVEAAEAETAAVGVGCRSRRCGCFADRLALLPPIGAARAASDQPVHQTGPLAVCTRTRAFPAALASAHSQSASCLPLPAPRPRVPAARAPSASTSALDRACAGPPALCRHRPRRHLHLSDDALGGDEIPLGPSPPPLPAVVLPAPVPTPTPAAPPPPRRPRCALCRRRLSAATLHRCRCGAPFCAPHRYAEVHLCAYDYKAAAAADRRNEAVQAPKLPKI